jgi:hypothetical protein
MLAVISQLQNPIVLVGSLFLGQVHFTCHTGNCHFQGNVLLVKILVGFFLGVQLHVQHLDVILVLHTKNIFRKEERLGKYIWPCCSTTALLRVSIWLARSLFSPEDVCRFLASFIEFIFSASISDFSIFIS